MRYIQEAEKELLSAHQYNAEQKDDSIVSLKVSKELVTLKQHKPGKSYCIVLLSGSGGVEKTL